MRKNLLGIVKNEHPHPSQKSSERLDVMRKTKKANQNPRASLLASLLRVVAKRKTTISLFF